MSNNKQQTAVEWFHQKNWALKIQLELGEISIGEYASTYATLYEQAKEMEKEQIINAFEQGENNSVDYFNPENRIKESEHYYNETYGGNK
jgi:hypothetical protein